MVPVGHYRNLAEAALDRAILEGAGIEAVISTDNAGGMLPLPFSGVIRLMVSPDEAEAALDMLGGSPDDEDPAA